MPEDPEMRPAVELPPTTGWVAGALADEFPALQLHYTTVEAAPGRSSPEVRARLRHLSDRFRGAQAISMRQDPIPWAYRVFYRHVGLDPDADRTPVEAAAVERLLKGAYAARNAVDDALLVAVAETGVPAWALDADRVSGRLGLRLAAAGEALGRGEGALPVPEGRIVVADEQSPLAVVFGEIAPGHGVTKKTRRMTLFTVQVAGVPAIHVEEALWLCVGALLDH